MRRRKFLALGLSVFAIPTINGCRNNSQWTAMLSRPSTVTQFCDEKELRLIGDAYHKLFPDEKSTGKLTDLILKKHNPSSSDDLKQIVEREKTRDFEAGDSVIVYGWVLSRTEARQCALYTLTAK